MVVPFFGELNQGFLEDVDGPRKHISAGHFERQGMYLSQDSQNVASYECPMVLVLDCVQTNPGIWDERHRNRQDWRETSDV